MTYPVKLAVTLRPVWHQDPPQIQVGVNNVLQDVVLDQLTVFEFEFAADTVAELQVKFLNKTDKDTLAEQQLDKAVIVESVSFFGVSDPRFVWAGAYYPEYPEPWASQQQGIDLETKLKSHSYLSWNGTWKLEFTVPVFTWMHQIQDLGWIYK